MKLLNIFLLPLVSLTSCSSNAVPHGSANVLEKSDSQLQALFGKPDKVGRNTMPDGKTFKIVFYREPDVSYIIDLTLDVVCEISAGFDEESYCYPCDYDTACP